MGIGFEGYENPPADEQPSRDGYMQFHGMCAYAGVAPDSDRLTIFETACWNGFAFLRDTNDVSRFTEVECHGYDGTGGAG